MFRISATLGLCLLSILPTMAQTAGAKAPEVTQFEPIDASQLVDKRTGDFTYSLPILAIPGAPGGAYPLNLSYHAGILYRAEASWVGLGWNLTPGQVTRTVSGYPDDYNGDEVLNVSDQVSRSLFSLATDSGWRNGVNEKFFSGRAEIWGFHQEIVRNPSHIRYQDYYGNYLGEEKGYEFSYADISTASAAHGGMGFEIPTSSKGFAGMSLTIESVFPAMAAYGYINTPRIKDLYNNTEAGIYDREGRQEPLDVFTRGLKPAYDFSFSRSFQSILTHLAARSTLDDDVEAAEASFLSDRATANVDHYFVAAHGIGGQIRPVLADRGWMIPADTVRAHHWEGTNPVPANGAELWMHPYRTILDMLDQLTADESTDTWRRLFDQSDQGWVEPHASTRDNMIFLDDPGYLQTREPLEEAGRPTLGTAFFGEGDEVVNSAKRVHYERDHNERIAKIVVTRDDGLRYIFGRHGEVVDDEGDHTGYRYGAAPRVTETNRYNETRETMTGTGSNETHMRQNAAYAYAWYLAAVESPDYEDHGAPGYSPDDKGDYIYFEYDTVAPAYQWQSPWSDDQDDPVFQYTGRVGARLQFERETGRKELAYLARAVTRTHVAVFEHGLDREDAQTFRLDNDFDRTNFQLTSEQLLIREMINSSTGSKYEFAGEERDLASGEVPVVLPLAYVRANTPSDWGQDIPVILELRLDAQIPTQSQQPEYDYYGDPGDPDHETENPRMKLVDVYPETGQALFLIHGIEGFDDTLARRVVSITIPGWSQHPVRLDGVRLYHTDTYANLVAGSTTDNLARPVALTTDTSYLSRVDLGFAEGLDRLQTRMPNSGNGAGPSLTLEEVGFQSRGGVPRGNGYRFDYYEPDPVLAAERDQYRKDPWGYYSTESNATQSVVDDKPLRPDDGDEDTHEDEQPIQAAWSLSEIMTPVGSRLSIAYERDRYSWVQDRIAVSPSFSSSNPFTIEAWDYNPGEEGSGIDWNKSDDELMVDLRQIVTLDLTGKWDRHVVAVVDYQMGESQFTNAQGGSYFCPQLFSRQFVLPLDESGTLEIGGALAHMIRWLRFIDDEMLGRGCDLHRARFYTIPINASMTRTGGGLRVSSITASEIGNDSERYTLRYSYTDPETWTNDPADEVPMERTGRDSGTIFSEPPPLTTGDLATDHYYDCASETPINVKRDDTRIIRAEEHSYQNMANPQVFYEHVAVRTEAPDGNNGVVSSSLQLFSHITARDPRINNPFGGDVETASIGGTSTPIPSDRHGLEKTVRDEAAESPPILENVSFPLRNREEDNNHANAIRSVTLARQTVQQVVNNTALLGNLRAVRFLDHRDPSRELTRTDYDFAAAYDPTAGNHLGDELNLYNWHHTNGALGEAAFPAGITQNHPQGAYIEQAMALVVGLELVGNGPDISALRARTLLREEVFNHFRPSRVVSRETFVQPDEGEIVLTATDETLGWDMISGSPSLTRRVSPDNTGTTRDNMVITVPAHVIFDQGISMRSLNMLTQPGLTLTTTGHGLDPTDLFPMDGIDGLDSQTLQGAEFVHWRRPESLDRTAEIADLAKPSDSAWASAATYIYVHANENKTSRDWLSMPIQTTSGALAKDVNTSGGGTWRLEGQNTLYNERLDVLEHQNRRDIASTVIMTEVRGVRLPAAVFQNARRDEVFYEGFEGPDPDLSTSPVPAYLAPPDLGEAVIDTVAPFHDRFTTTTGQPVYAGLGSHRLGTDNAMTFNAPLNGDTHLTFYARPASAAITVTGITEEIRLEPGRRDDVVVTAVDHGWYHVRIRFATTPGSITIAGPANATIDEICLIPAANEGQTGDADATVTLTAYHPVWLKPISITDIRGRTMRYEYNLRGELFREYDIDGGLLREHFRAEPGEALRAGGAYRSSSQSN